ncbi:mitochondrial fission ELM1 family protein [Telmatospirillum sp.]|uniref:mitochondrial fission ELM1 family protein n=1 Tax=Telmatospirillum sp. TaxID=2079197 RepID=UPI00284AF6DC|nr:mitochondrial fission ELM1 family protein [Telmatospirillum sp.]MDR3435406.1 mitochondrial fission ELM1 family protein [Telmatospirillum sp.]
MVGARVWVLADDRPGNVAQAVGVAEALGESFVTQEIRYDRLGGLPNIVRGVSLVGIAGDSRESLGPPWPDLVIAAGRRTAPLARWLKRQSSCRLVQIMDPGWPGRGDFDLIAVPRHDLLPPRANVFQTLGACHRVVAPLLAAEAAKWTTRLIHLPRPYLLVVLGGGTKTHGFPAARGTELAAGVAALHASEGGTVLLTNSRRTSPELMAAVLAGIAEPRFIHRWQSGGENPYLGFLGLADSVVVTGDSMSMCSEACANGGPVYIFAPPELVSAKHARLHRSLFEQGFARPLGGDMTPWTHPPLNAAADVAAEIRRRGLL